MEEGQLKRRSTGGWKSEETLGGQISISFSREKAAEIQLGKADIITDDAVVDTRRGRQADRPDRPLSAISHASSFHLSPRTSSGAL